MFARSTLIKYHFLYIHFFFTYMLTLLSLCVYTGRQKMSNSSQMKVTKMLLIVSTVFVLLNLPDYDLRIQGFLVVGIIASHLESKWNDNLGPRCLLFRFYCRKRIRRKRFPIYYGRILRTVYFWRTMELILCSIVLRDRILGMHYVKIFHVSTNCENIVCMNDAERECR